MADQPQTPNASRITAMLQDLAAQKPGAQQPTTPPSAPTQPSPRPPASTPVPSSVPPPAPMQRPIPPPNLPTAPARPTPPPPIGAIPPPRPMAPPPAPREPAVSVAPLPKPPMPPPPAVPQQPAPPAATPSPVIPAIAPQKPASADVSTELRTMSADVGNIKIGQAPQGIQPPSAVAPMAPSAPSAPSAIQAPSSPAPRIAILSAPSSINIPEASDSGSGMTRKIIYGVLGVLILGGVAYSLISLMGSSGEPVATDSPTPSASTTATPSAKSLSDYIGSSKKTIDVPAGSSIVDLFTIATEAVPPQGGLATTVTVKSDGTTLDAVGVLALLDSTVAQEWKALAGTDQAVLLYGQKEHFDSTGAPDSTKSVDSRFVFIVEVTDASAASQLLTKQLVPDSRIECTGYNAGTYRQIPIQYRNCPFADNAEDFAIMLVGNEKNYLIIAESREAMFFAIDQLSQ